MAASIFTVIFGAVCIVGLIFESKLVAFEDWIAEKVRNHKKF